jgi:2-polyprenyl-3-methyl-5-hydroxy-6-metoxy-1,4-benzoquinol methylase
MFERPDTTYALAPEAAARVLADPVNPLHQISRVIPDGSRVLDVGAGNGLLAQVLHARRIGLVLDGIEPSAGAAELAAPHYRTMRVGFAEEFLDEIRGESYDYLVLADVIEHTTNPLAFVRTLVDAAPRARLVVSVPHIAFVAVRMALLHGRFDYVDSGLLERTHLRFFTQATLARLWELAGLHVERRILLKKSAFASELDATPTSLADVFELARLRRDPLSSVYQFVFVLGHGAGAPTHEEFGRTTSLAEILGSYRAARKRAR